MESGIGAIRAYDRGAGLVMPVRKTAFGMKGDLCPFLTMDSKTIKTALILQGHDDHSLDVRGSFPAPSGFEIRTEAMKGSLKSLQPVNVAPVSQTCFEPLWNHLVKKHHYLSYRNLLGRRLKYLAFIGGRPAAALSFSAPALKLRARDLFIGWSDEQRKVFLGRMVSNSRFLIMPWVQIPCLASHVLSL